MDWEREHLPEYLDESGELAPPWARFPEYERGTIGWRMGPGETWWGLWRVFLERFEDSDQLVSYLHRHPKAPHSWGDVIHHHLFPEEEWGLDSEVVARLKELQLVDSDVAYRTWRNNLEQLWWPWERMETPEKAARYLTRDTWFWSRRASELRDSGELDLPDPGEPWTEWVQAARTGEVPDLEGRSGLTNLSLMLAAGRVIPPWVSGLGPPGDLNVEMTMDDSEAFYLWLLSAFDDLPHLDRYLQEWEAPANWREWCGQNLRCY